MDLFEEIGFQTTTETISELGEQKIKDKARIRYLATPCLLETPMYLFFLNESIERKL